MGPFMKDDSAAAPRRAGCSKRPSSKAAASEEAKRTLGRTLSL